MEVDLEGGTVDTEDDLGLIGDLEVGIDISEDQEVEIEGILEEEKIDTEDLEVKRISHLELLDQQLLLPSSIKKLNKKWKSWKSQSK